MEHVPIDRPSASGMYAQFMFDNIYRVKISEEFPQLMEIREFDRYNESLKRRRQIRFSML